MTFQPPNLDGSLTLPEIYDWHLDHSPNHPLFVFRPASGELRTIPWAQGVKNIHGAANYFNAHIGSTSSQAIVAVLAVADAFSYFIATVGLMRAGYSPFPLSNRNSAAAVAHLIKEMKVEHIITTDDHTTQQLLRSSLDILDSEGAATGLAVSAFAPDSPVLTPGPEQVLKAAQETKSTMMICVPSFLESWAQSEVDVATLKEFTSIMFAGAPLSKHVGDYLTSIDVRIALLYGSTETGSISTILPSKPHPEGWEYFELSPHLDPILVPEGEGGVFRLVIAPSKNNTPAVTNTRVNNKIAYDTNDLLQRHPVNSRLYRIYGRADDQIMHSTGEKTSPVPIENILMQHPQIEHAVMFGRGRFHAGVIIEPAPTCFDDFQQGIFLDGIQSSIDKANNFAPSHSKIFREMVIIADPTRPLVYTPKGTPKRGVILEAYEKEIENVYASFEETIPLNFPIPSIWTLASILELSRAVVKTVMSDNDLQDDVDIFQLGCDSLHANRIYNALVQYLRRADFKVGTLPRHFIYANPTIRQLANSLYQKADAAPSAPSDDTLANKTIQMSNLVSKYSENLPITNHGDVDGTDEEVVLLTGSTGSLGAFMLASLLENPAIALVYALNRRGANPTESLHSRQSYGFETNGINTQLAKSPKLILLEADVALPDLGISPTLFDEMCRRVTCILHTAWKVDFNLSLLSMEPLIAGTRHLVDLALRSYRASPPKFIFVSSAGVFANATNSGSIPEEPVLDSSVSVGTGYSESKWVAESMLRSIAQRSTLQPTIVRVGQLCGGQNGRWKASEWFPAIVCGSQAIGSLPILHGDAAWIPTDIAAAALIEMRRTTNMYLNLQHPAPVPTDAIMSFMSSSLGLDMIPFYQWVARLEAAEGSKRGLLAKSGRSSHALRLLEFFKLAVRGHEESTREVLTTPCMTINKAIVAAPMLNDLEPLTIDDMGRWFMSISQQLLHTLETVKEQARDALWALSSCLCQQSAKVKINGRTFTIVKVLGEGGFSFVYLAQDDHSGRQFALKKIRCPTGHDGVKEAMREVEAYRRFRHPNIIRILDSAVVQDPDGEGKIVYLFLPLYKRGNLQDAINTNVVNRTHFPEKEMVRLFKGTCEAIRAMHDYRAPIRSTSNANPAAGSSSRNQQEASGRHSDDDERFPQPEGDAEGGYSYDGASVPLVTRQRIEEQGDVVFDGDEEAQHNGTADPSKTEHVPYAHRDLKPGNVMIADDGVTPILMDFGSTIKARIKIDTRSQALLQQDIAAEQSTMAYRAPELFDVKTGHTLDEKVDIWSLGCTLYALAYSHSPFENTQTTEQGGSIAMAVLNAQYKHPDSAYSQGLKDLIDSMLKVNPGDRPNIHQVIEKADGVLRSLS
ncbi:putative PKS/NRPS-like protein biosynthetic cluster [Pleurotus pulmonarius]|nr:putative PKS/NRPS-like protein biosynthetic cluster [Pleurotus pulmonarius]